MFLMITIFEEALNPCVFLPFDCEAVGLFASPQAQTDGYQMIIQMSQAAERQLWRKKEEKEA